MEPVKRTRRYDASGRRAQARRTREAILDIAQRRFLSDGYAATTVAAIARESGVSVESIYKGFGGKAGLVKGLYERGLQGRGPVPATQRSDQMKEAATDPLGILRHWGTFAAEVASTLTPILLLVRAAAATDPDMAAFLDHTDDQRLERMRQNAGFLAARGYLRDGVTVDEAADVLWTASSYELYEVLVLKRGWSPERFSRFVAEMMAAALLPAPPAPG
jgi:AcrR family transcriptional regulator